MFWPLAFFKVLVRRRREGRTTPILAGFKLTHRCNLRCLHCPFWKRGGRDLDFPGVVEALHRLRDLGVLMVIFEGGEPLLWKDGERGFADVVNAASPLFLRVGVTTNGTLPLTLHLGESRRPRGDP
ncbi:MAG: radical SAM protein [Planctomycetota bacterium]|jgi:MoaA/NifB/PqqE/SkfB family radical SAM enzyme